MSVRHISDARQEASDVFIMRLAKRFGSFLIYRIVQRHQSLQRCVCRYAPRQSAKATGGTVERDRGVIACWHVVLSQGSRQKWFEIRLLWPWTVKRDH